MNNQNSTRLLLRITLKLMVMMAVLAFLWILFASLPERGPDVTEVVRYDITTMQPGDHRLVEWQKKPLYIVYRKPDWEAALLSADAALYHDPESLKSSQPEAAMNRLRSAQSGWFVTLGLGSGMGCTLVFSEPSPTATSVEAQAGGFVDGCDQSHYDLAGRVYVNPQARRNTVVPKWSLVAGEMLVGG